MRSFDASELAIILQQVKPDVIMSWIRDDPVLESLLDTDSLCTLVALNQHLPFADSFAQLEKYFRMMGSEIFAIAAERHDLKLVEYHLPGVPVNCVLEVLIAFPHLSEMCVPYVLSQNLRLSSLEYACQLGNLQILDKMLMDKGATTKETIGYAISGGNLKSLEHVISKCPSLIEKYSYEFLAHASRVCNLDIISCILQYTKQVDVEVISNVLRSRVKDSVKIAALDILVHQAENPILSFEDVVEKSISDVKLLKFIVDNNLFCLRYVLLCIRMTSDNYDEILAYAVNAFDVDIIRRDLYILVTKHTTKKGVDLLVAKGVPIVKVFEMYIRLMNIRHSVLEYIVSQLRDSDEVKVNLKNQDVIELFVKYNLHIEVEWLTDVTMAKLVLERGIISSDQVLERAVRSSFPNMARTALSYHPTTQPRCYS